MMEYDFMIRHGRVLDGTGNPWFHADIGIANGRIQAIGRLSAADGRVVLDATHRVVTPGFIDMHSHSDFRYLVNPHAESKIRQGITTEVIGNCGFVECRHGAHSALIVLYHEKGNVLEIHFYVPGASTAFVQQERTERFLCVSIVSLVREDEVLRAPIIFECKGGTAV